MVAEFTTGTAALEQTPLAPVVGPLGDAEFLSYPNSSCGAWARCLQALEVRRLPEGVLLRVMRGDVWMRDFWANEARTLSFGGVEGWPGNGPDVRGEGDFQLFAVDEAGNRSPATHVSAKGCTGTWNLDGGTPGSNPRPPNTDEDAADDEGCMLASSTASSSWLLLGLLALARRSRRRQGTDI